MHSVTAPSYKCTQFGTLTVSTLVAAIGFLIFLEARTSWKMVTAFTICILIVCLLLFYSLTVEIRNGRLSVRFGIGLFRKSFSLSDIENAFPVRNRWYYGWGIHLSPHGWLFNVSGLEAVEIVLTTGKHYRIGTPEPNKLVQAINGIKHQSA